MTKGDMATRIDKDLVAQYIKPIAKNRDPRDINSAEKRFFPPDFGYHPYIPSLCFDFLIIRLFAR